MDALDGILGRDSLKERIEDLEDERDRLAAQLDAEEERRRAAVRERQSAQERANELEDRVAGLEGELDRQRSDTDDRSWTRVETIDRTGASAVVEMLSGIETSTEGALSAAVHETVPEAVRTLFDESVPIDRATPCLVYGDEHRLVRCVIAPPRMPPAFSTWDDHFHLDREWLLPTDRTAFALARSDLFAVGVVEDGRLQYDRGFASDVMGAHEKGGFSQSRFERRRDEQIDDHVARCREELEDETERDVVLVGDRRIVGQLGDLAATTGVVDASGRPRDALPQAFEDFWTTRLYLP